MPEREGVRRWRLWPDRVNDRPGEPSEPVVDGPKFTESVLVIEAAPVEELVEAADYLLAAAGQDDATSSDFGVLQRALAPFTEDTDHDA